MTQLHWKTSWQFLTKLNTVLTHGIAVVLLDIYLTGFETYVHTKTCVHMFIADLFIISTIWKESKCPSQVKG